MSLLSGGGLLRTRCTDISVKLCEHLYTELHEMSIKGASETETRPVSLRKCLERMENILDTYMM